MNEANSIKDLNLYGKLEKVVICIPTNSTVKYKENIFKAAIMAGIGFQDENACPIFNKNGTPVGVVLLEEPIAVALRYCIDFNFFSNIGKQNIMVYDFSKKRFDATILSVHSKSIFDSETQLNFKIHATKGVAGLGDDAIVYEIMKITAARIKDTFGIDIFNMRTDQRATPLKELKKAQQKLKEHVEYEKIMSFATGSPEVEADFQISNILKDGDGESYDLSCKIKKSEVLARIEPLLNRAIECTDNALAKANISIDDVDQIALMGEASKADWVYKKLKSHYSKDPYTSPHIHLCGSRGAAFLVNIKTDF